MEYAGYQANTLARAARILEAAGIKPDTLAEKHFIERLGKLVQFAKTDTIRKLLLRAELEDIDEKGRALAAKADTIRALLKE